MRKKLTKKMEVLHDGKEISRGSVKFFASKDLEDPGYIRESEITRLANVSPSRLERWRNIGKVKAQKADGSWFYLRTDLIAAITSDSLKR